MFLRGHIEIIKLLAPLCDNFSAHGGFTKGTTLIYHVVSKNRPELIKIIAPYMENPNAPDCNGKTPINCANHLGLKHGIHPSLNECLKILKTYQ